MDQDFTSDKAALLKGVGKYNGTEGTGFANGNEGGNSGGTADDASSFTADDSEYNALNTDRELYAIRTIAKSLERVDQRKSMLYFSGGLTRQGIENQASMRAATNEAVKANMAIYSVDSRGLQALPPVGDASTGQSARNRGLQRRGDAEPVELRTSARRRRWRHSRVGYGRQTVLRLERLCSGVPAGPARHRGVLHPRVPLDQYGAGWKLSPSDGEAEPQRREDRLPARILCAGGLPARRRPKTASWR